MSGQQPHGYGGYPYYPGYGYPNFPGNNAVYVQAPRTQYYPTTPQGQADTNQSSTLAPRRRKTTIRVSGDDGKEIDLKQLASSNTQEPGTQAPEQSAPASEQIAEAPKDESAPVSESKATETTTTPTSVAPAETKAEEANDSAPAATSDAEAPESTASSTEENKVVEENVDQTSDQSENKEATAAVPVDKQKDQAEAEKATEQATPSATEESTAEETTEESLKDTEPASAEEEAAEEEAAISNDTEDDQKDDDDWEKQNDEEAIRNSVNDTETSNQIAGSTLRYSSDELRVFRANNTERPDTMPSLEFLNKNMSSGGGGPRRNNKGGRGSKSRGNKGGGNFSSRRGRGPKVSKVRPEKVYSEEETIIRNATSILNKMVPESMDKLTLQLKALDLSDDILKVITEKIFEKALLEPKYCKMYSQLCKTLTDSGREETGKLFRKTLLNLCEKEFRDRSDTVAATDESAATEAQEELEYISRMRMRGNMEFVGELYQQGLIPEKVVRMCFINLLNKVDNTNMECFCKLMTTVGKQYSGKPQNATIMDQFFGKLQESKNQKELDSRIRFMIMDLMDLRRNNWIPRQKKNQAKTIEEVHREAAIAQQEKERSVRSAPSSRGSRFANSSSGNRYASPSVKKPATNTTTTDSDGFTTVSGAVRGGNRGSGRNNKEGTSQSIRATKNAFSSLSNSSPLRRSGDSMERRGSKSQAQESTPTREEEEEAPETVVKDRETIKNNTDVTLEEFFGSGDLTEAVSCVKEIIVNDDTELQTNFIKDCFNYCFDKNKGYNDLIDLFKRLSQEKILQPANMTAGFRDIIADIDETAEISPVAPSKVGQTVVALSDELDGGVISVTESLNDIEPMNAAKIITELLKDDKFDLSQANLSSEQLFQFKLTTLKTNLKSQDVPTTCTWSENNIDAKERENPKFTKEVFSHVSRQFARSWQLETVSEKDLADETALFEKFKPLLELFVISPEAKKELQNLVNRQRDPLKSRIENHLASILA